MSGLVEWLRRQLDDDERIARLASHAQGGSAQWRYDSFRDPDYGTTHGLDIGDRTFAATVEMDEALRPEEMQHIARHDPARVLAEVDAKRRLLDGHERAVHRCDGGEMTWVDEDCRIKVALALPYADRPGYRDEWRP